jgi:short-subunit dehydrogenase
LVTGASAGIGLELARQLAAGGTHLVLTARRTARLQELAQEFSASHGIKVETFGADLTRSETPRQIFDFTASKGIEIDLLINNAGFGGFGYHHELPEVKVAEMIQVNCTAVAALTSLFTRGMIERRRGDIMIVSSVAAFQPVPFNSVYAATKAFDLLLAEGIAEELRGLGIRVSALCPGSTNTEFQNVAGQPDRMFRVAETAEKVARVGLEGLAKGKTVVISGGSNTAMILLERLAPRRFVAKMALRMMNPAREK